LEVTNNSPFKESHFHHPKKVNSAEKPQSFLFPKNSSKSLLILFRQKKVFFSTLYLVLLRECFGHGNFTRRRLMEQLLD